MPPRWFWDMLLHWKPAWLEAGFLAMQDSWNGQNFLRHTGSLRQPQNRKLRAGVFATIHGKPA
jgi:hypothetical protein